MGCVVVVAKMEVEVMAVENGQRASREVAAEVVGMVATETGVARASLSGEAIVMTSIK